MWERPPRDESPVQCAPVAYNEALYSLIGTTYGGNTTDFSLPSHRSVRACTPRPV
ncbi:MAG: tail fiber protein [Acidimicrobiales bacterium]